MRPRNAVLTGAAAVALVSTIGGIAVNGAAPPAARAAQHLHVSTATVQREDLSVTTSQDGTLSYAAQPDGSPYTVINRASGTYSELPAVGHVIRQGHVLYRVSGTPVLLLRGAVPAYRTLSEGMTGEDVAQLNRDLIALGYATAEITPISDFGLATTDALKKLQAAHGIAQTGRLPLGQALFEPCDIRVTTDSALLGAGAQAGQPVLQGTSTSRQVRVALTATDSTDVAVGDKVSITLPDNQRTAGVVSFVGTVATCPSSSTAAGSSSSSTSTGTDSCSSGGSIPTVSVDITPSDPTATGVWDQASVQVGIITARVAHALVAPVNALLARSPGGYSVEVVGRAGSHQLVPVSLGLFDDADGVVQITGSHLASGEKVVVPST